MKKLFLSVASVGLICGSSRADLTLTTSNPPGTPLIMPAGTTSGPMLVSVVVADAHSPNDMAAWQFTLEIAREAGATGTVTFQDPMTTMTGAPPNDYIFGASFAGIFATNTGNQLSANDFYTELTGGVVPGPTDSNLLQMDFLASTDASGLFGIYVLEGAANTVWTNGENPLENQYFSNVPDGTGSVLIGEVLISQAVSVPEPSTLVISGMAALLTIAHSRTKSRRAQLYSKESEPNPGEGESCS